MQAPSARRTAVDPKSLLEGIPDLRDPGIENPGIFFDFQRMNPPALSLATESPRRKNVDLEKDADPFHDSETVDIYDLYNACNGVVLSNGLLDISKLDEFSPEESEALDVPRLREIWHHTKSRCSQCERIISTLNMVRGTLRAGAKDSSGERSNTADADGFAHLFRGGCIIRHFYSFHMNICVTPLEVSGLRLPAAAKRPVELDQ
jgi:hypothetical protein